LLDRESFGSSGYGFELLVVQFNHAGWVVGETQPLLFGQAVPIVLIFPGPDDVFGRHSWYSSLANGILNDHSSTAYTL
jgi:hypothetical protein